MTAPPPAPRPPADPPPVRLEVRLGGAPADAYDLAGPEFLVGGSDACDLRLPGAHLPAVVCRLVRTPAGLVLRRTDPAFPVLVNGTPAGDQVRVDTGDRIAVGPADLTVTVGTAHLRPRFVPIDPDPPTSLHANPVPDPPGTVPLPPRPRVEVVPDQAAVAAERADLARLRAELEEQVRELEADRVAWYRRRQEMEAEHQRFRDRSPGEQDLARREAELDRAREELAGIRQHLFDQYQERRDQLNQMQEVARGAAADLAERQRQFEEEAARRQLELDDRERRIDEQVHARVDDWRAYLEAEFRQHLEAALAPTAEERSLAEREERLRQDQDRHADDLVRLDRWQGSLQDRQAQLDRRAEEIDQRYDQLRRDTAELEENARLADAQQQTVTAEADRLEKFRTDLEGQSARLAERSAQLEAQQAMLAVLRARLDRRQEEVRQQEARLAADRARVDDAQRDLDGRLREAEKLRAELTTAREDQAEQAKLITERTALLDATLAEIKQQKDAAAAEQARLSAKEAELDARTADLAEQAATLKARLTQAIELQERLEADRTAVRERESTLTDADTARQTFQEQLRRRAEEIGSRSKHLDESARRLADERADLDRQRAGLTAEREELTRTLTAAREELARRSAELTDREAAQERQVARLRETGKSMAAGRKDLAEARRQWEADRLAAEAAARKAREEIDALRRETPDLEERAKATLERATAARDVLRGHLGELHAYAGQTRDELHAESERLREREQALEKARSEHRLAVAEFRQQMLDWQARVEDLRQTMARSETRIESRQGEVDAAAKQMEAATVELARQADELRREKERVAERRTEVERHLSDMREWYRRKLKELAASNAERGTRNAERQMIAGRIGGDSDRSEFRVPSSEFSDLDPGDKQLGELLQGLELVDGETLATLWAEAQRQRRTLRQVLLASGAITLYQLALIEAGNLDGLMLGRLRVVDRLRVTAREAVYRVFDPTRGGVFQLRHLSESEMDDAVRPDEFRQRFAAARDAAHPNLAGTLEVLEVNGRPAALQEWLTGLPGGDWPEEVGTPGVWVRLLAEAAAGLDAAHRAGLAHGRLTSDSLLLTPDGRLKVTGFGDPPWLAGGPTPLYDPTPGDDLRALGQVAFGWSQLAAPAAKPKRRGKGFPESLVAVVRRLEADPQTPMADTTAGAVPYRTAAELVADLGRLAAAFPCPADAWDRLVRHAADNATDGAGLRRSA